MPLLEEILQKLGQSKVISKLDLSKGFHQVPIHPIDVQKTAFVCPCGKFEFQRMPFGLRNTLAVFQELMVRVLDSCREFARPYIDDIIVFSADWFEHLEHLKKVLQSLKEAGLTANPTKCE